MQKITEEEYNNLYVTSDTHFGHNKEFIYKKRGYENVQDMNESMIDTINTTVGKNGILLHLGDFCLNTTREEYNNIVRRFNIKSLWLMLGNHNSPIQSSNCEQMTKISEFNGKTHIRHLHYYYTFSCKKQSVVCFHFPLVTWDGESNGSFCLTGHSHGNYNMSLPENKEKKILDVGYCVHGKPLSMKEIENIMSTKGNNN